MLCIEEGKDFPPQSHKIKEHCESGNVIEIQTQHVFPSFSVHLNIKRKILFGKLKC